MLKSLDELLTRAPKHLMTFGLIVACLRYLPFCLLLSIPMLGIALMIDLSTRIYFVAGILLLMASKLSYNISVSDVLQINDIIFYKLFWHHTISINITDTLVVVPIALLLSGTAKLLLPHRSRIEADLNQLSQGKIIKKQHVLSNNTLTKSIEMLNSSTSKTGSILGLTVEAAEPVILTDEDANHHTLILGTTGSGKTNTVCHVIESAISRGLSLWYVDGKGDIDLSNRIENFAKSEGRKFYRFSMVGESVTYNPLASGGRTSKKDRIISLRSWSEEHYLKIAEGYLQDVFYLLEKFEITVNLSTLAQYIQPNAFTDLARQLDDDSVWCIIEGLDARYKDISSLIAEIDNLSKSEIGHLFDFNEQTGLTLHRAFEENAVVYFCLQPLAFPTYAESLGKLIINDIKAFAAEQLSKSTKSKIYTVFDEFSVFAGEQIVNLINQGRGAGIHALLSTQSLSDIAIKGGEPLVGQVVNNCNNLIIHRQNNPADAEVLSNIIGTHDTLQLTSQRGGQELDATGSIRQAKEYIVHPDVIKRLCLGQAIYMAKSRFTTKVFSSHLSKIFREEA